MIHTIYMEPLAEGANDETALSNRLDTVQAVPETTAKWALIFAPFWLIRHQLWFELVIYALVSVFALALLATPYAPVTLFLSSLPGLYLFLEGHQLRRKNLESSGFKMVATIDAENATVAEEKFVTQFLEAWEEPKQFETMRPARARNTPNSSPTFGLFPVGDM